MTDFHPDHHHHHQPTGAQLVRRIRDLTALRLFIQRFIEDFPMAVSPEVQAAFDEINAALDTETSEISAMVQALIDKANSGASSAEIVALANGVKARIAGISDALPTGT